MKGHQVRIGRGLIGLTAIAVLAVAGGIAYAAIPGSDGAISGCYSKKSGALRVIDSEAGANCSASEKSIVWNQQGPQGVPGVSGFEYVQGADIAGQANEFKSTTVLCPPGKMAISGGFDHNTDNRVVLVSSGPADVVHGTNDHGWYVKVFITNVPPYPLSVRTFAVCANAS